jgi:hypothetical protein
VTLSAYLDALVGDLLHLPAVTGAGLEDLPLVGVLGVSPPEYRMATKVLQYPSTPRR